MICPKKELQLTTRKKYVKIFGSAPNYLQVKTELLDLKSRLQSVKKKVKDSKEYGRLKFFLHQIKKKNQLEVSNEIPHYLMVDSGS
jgi:hypothetical protein